MEAPQKLYEARKELKDMPHRIHPDVVVRMLEWL